jgi:error-prone DNA polymerase
VDDYLATGLTLRQHPLALLRPRLDQLHCADTQRLNAARPGSWIRLPGLALIRQRPGTAKGIVFLTVEDEHGTGNLVVYPDVAARDRAALVSGRLLLAEGWVEREAERAEVPIIHLIVRRLTDRSDLLDSLLQEGGTPDGESQAGDGGLSDAAKTEGHPGQAEPGVRPPEARPTASRDFR